MRERTPPPEPHFVHRIGWLRAAVLGANDGIVSTASLIAGVASAGSSHADILLAGTAGMVAGALSMAAGEYISVSSQADTEAADLSRERHELATRPEAERRELAAIYRARGLDAELAEKVAEALMRHDALGAHARDELGLAEITQARPLQAALSSAASFTAGAALPLAAVALSPLSAVIPVTTLVSLLALALLGAVSARTGGAPIWRAVLRVSFWGAVAMAGTAAVGAVFGITAA
ncbi:MAG: VIT family protein [Alphaproteobacteria bacterium]|nr:MAG: VIT family protein [Alphaproteobacteria bacterium]